MSSNFIVSGTLAGKYHTLLLNLSTFQLPYSILSFRKALNYFHSTLTVLFFFIVICVRNTSSLGLLDHEILCSLAILFNRKSYQML
jgi:small-conductance mechanosensitive channel